MRYAFVMAATPDGRVRGYVRGVLGTTVYARTERACIARLKVALRQSLKRSREETRDAFLGMQPR